MKALSKKEKLLAAAQKNLLKGQIVKAIKDYEKIVQADAKDIRNRQKLAELYSRADMAEKSLETYESVAKHYEGNGFLLKALAVYKQMQKVDAARPEICQRLAELNVKQGLIGNALTEYRNLVHLYRRQGELDEAVRVLGQMKDLDPDNLTIALQVAEGYSQTWQQDKAAECLIEVLQKIAPSADLHAVERIQEVVQFSCPASALVKIELARGFFACGQASRSIELLQEVPAEDGLEGEALLLLADSYRATDDHERERATCQKLLDIDSTNIYWRKRFAVALLADNQAQQALTELEQVKDSILAEGRAADLKQAYERIREQLPDDEQAIASLQAIYEATGEGGKLFDLMSSHEDDAVTVEEVVAESVVDPASEASFGELDLDDGPPSPDTGENALAGTEDEMEPAAQDVFADEEKPSQGGGLEFDDLDLDGIEFGLDEEPSADAGTGPESGGDEVEAGAAPVRSMVDVSGEFEEAEFYFQQGLLEEAASKCRFLLEQTDDCPQAQELLERIAGTPAPQVADKAEAKGAAGSTSALQGLEDRERSRLDGSFSEFKKGLENQVSAEDTETHYNLGIAYKEMGLLDDAISQFDKVMVDPQRRIDCLTLKGVCLVQKGAFDEAVATFKEGLAIDKLSDGERISLYYELGLLYIDWGQPLEALDSFQCVADVDPFFRNVDDQIRQLRKKLGLDDDNGGSPSGNSSDKSRVSYI